MRQHRGTSILYCCSKKTLYRHYYCHHHQNCAMISGITRNILSIIQLLSILHVLSCSASYNTVVAFQPLSNSLHRHHYSINWYHHQSFRNIVSSPKGVNVVNPTITTRLHAIINNDDIKVGRLVEYVPPSSSKSSK